LFALLAWAIYTKFRVKHRENSPLRQLNHVELGKGIGYAEKNQFFDRSAKSSAMIMSSGIGDIDKGYYENV
jgi:hypothetical protein